MTMQDRWGNALPCDLANDDHDDDDDNDAGSDADDDVDGDDDDDDDSGGGSDDNGGQIFLPTPPAETGSLSNRVQCCPFLHQLCTISLQYRTVLHCQLYISPLCISKSI